MSQPKATKNAPVHVDRLIAKYTHIEIAITCLVFIDGSSNYSDRCQHPRQVAPACQSAIPVRSSRYRHPPHRHHCSLARHSTAALDSGTTLATHPLDERSHWPHCVVGSHSQDLLDRTMRRGLTSR